MEDPKKWSVFRLLTDGLETFFKLFRGFADLLGLEAQLAKRSLVTIVILALCLWCLLIATWLSVLALILAVLLTLHVGLLVSLSSIVLLNLLLILVICWVVLRLKKDLFFPATRRLLCGRKS